MLDEIHPKRQELSILIRRIDADQAENFWKLAARFEKGKDRGYYEECLERQASGDLLILIAEKADTQEPLGYGILNFQPKYAFFKTHDIPEIQDLNVLAEYRRQGIGEKLIRHNEALALQQGYTRIGIGVGLTASYGPAQRLYTRLGFIPDGNGITYDRRLVTSGEFRPIDDHLCLMMTKPLK